MKKDIVKLLVGTDSIDRAFLVTAIERYSREVLSDSTKWGDKSLINQDLWKVVAQQKINTIEEYYK